MQVTPAQQHDHGMALHRDLLLLPLHDVCLLLYHLPLDRRRHLSKEIVYAERHEQDNMRFCRLCSLKFDMVRIQHRPYHHAYRLHQCTQ